MKNLPYFRPEDGKRWETYWSLSADYPHSLLPDDRDMPEIGVYQIWPATMPEDIPEGMTLVWLLVPELGEDGKYHEVYEIIPIEDLPADLQPGPASETEE